MENECLKKNLCRNMTSHDEFFELPLCTNDTFLEARLCHGPSVRVYKSVLSVLSALMCATCRGVEFTRCCWTTRTQRPENQDTMSQLKNKCWCSASLQRASNLSSSLQSGASPRALCAACAGIPRNPTLHSHSLTALAWVARFGNGSGN